MVQEHEKKELHKAKTSKELSELSKISLITSSQELYKEVRTIQHSSITSKTTAKLKLVRNQISIRKKILLQNISIPFTQCKTKRPIKHIIKDLENFILLQEQTDPFTLVGRQIKHKFKNSDTCEEEWYAGNVISYNEATKLHKVTYSGEAEPCQFDLIEDLVNGDLIIN